MVPRRPSPAASCASSVAASACCAAARDRAAPRPTAPAMPRRLPRGAESDASSFMRLSWLLRGPSMLKPTQASAGMNSREMVPKLQEGRRGRGVAGLRQGSTET